MKKQNRHIKQLFEVVRIIPVRERGRGEVIFGAFRGAVADLGYGEAEAFGVKEIPAVKGKT